METLTTTEALARLEKLEDVLEQIASYSPQYNDDEFSEHHGELAYLMRLHARDALKQD